MKDQAREALLPLFGLLERLSRGASPFGGGAATHSPAAQGQALVDRDEIVRLRDEVRRHLLATRASLERLLSEREVYLALFPIVVCADELVQTRYANVDQTIWPLLQREFFQVDQGGELFYATIDEGLEASRFAPIIYEIFYFCLAIGFGGKHSGNEEQLAGYMRKLAGKLAAAAPPPPEEDTDISASGTIRPTRSHWWYYLAAFAFVALVYVILSALADDDQEQALEAPAKVAALSFPAMLPAGQSAPLVTARAADRASAAEGDEGSEAELINEDHEEPKQQDNHGEVEQGADKAAEDALANEGDDARADQQQRAELRPAQRGAAGYPPWAAKSDALTPASGSRICLASVARP